MGCKKVPEKERHFLKIFDTRILGLWKTRKGEWSILEEDYSIPFLWVSFFGLPEMDKYNSCFFNEFDDDMAMMTQFNRLN